MAFLRFSRDKRGYEHFYLVEATPDRRGKTRARVLYWFRTPPGVKVGREPFDADVRRALESQNPTVTFDWRKIVETPIPSADAERWRERRRAERAEKAAREAIARDRPAISEPLSEDDDVTEDVSVDAAEQQADALAPTEDSLVAQAATIDAPPAAARTGRRRRRRRGSRGAQGVQAPQASPPEPHEPHPQGPGEAGEASEASEAGEPDEPGDSGDPGDPVE